MWFKMPITLELARLLRTGAEDLGHRGYGARGSAAAEVASEQQLHGGGNIAGGDRVTVIHGGESRGLVRDLDAEVSDDAVHRPDGKAADTHLLVVVGHTDDKVSKAVVVASSDTSLLDWLDGQSTVEDEKAGHGNPRFLQALPGRGGWGSF